MQATAATLTVSDCRICKWNDGPGRTRLDRGKPFAEPNNLFVNHHNKFFHGRPKFVEMSIWRGGKVCFEVRACTKFLHPRVKYDPAHGDFCQVVVDSKANKKKSKYTCSVERCYQNCWVCSVHKLDNKDVLEEIMTQQKTKGLTMGFHVRLNVGWVKEKVGRESLSSSDSLPLTPEASITAAQ